MATIPKTTKKRLSLATLITRIVVLVLGIMTIGIFIQSYYFSSRIIEQEVERTKVQTSTLLINVFDYHLTSLQSHHDTTARNPTLTNYFTTMDEESLNYFYMSLDEKDPSRTPEIRFVTKRNELIWDDGNAHFYGVNELLLESLASKVSYSGNWHYMPVHTLMGHRHMLIRKVPIVDEQYGEVLGQSFIIVVLDNNFPLVELLESRSNSDKVILMVGDDVIASTLTGNEEYTLSELFELAQENSKISDFLVGKTTLSIDAVSTPLTLISVHSNVNVSRLQKQHYFSISISIVIMAILSLLIREWIQAKVTSALQSLMNYTRSASHKAGFVRFEGSNIQEFAHIGYTLESTFEQLEAQRKSFKDLFNFALSPIMVWSESGLLIQMNPAARKELVIETMDSIEQMHPLFQEFKLKLAPHLRMAAQGATLTGINVPIGDKVFRWNLSPIRVEEGITGIIVQGQDITTLIEAEKQSNLARQEAEHSAKARADFLAKMSHEIRTPLNGILGISQLLKRSVSSAEDRQRVEVLCNSGEHLLAVMNDILDFSKIEQGKFQLQKTLFTFDEVVSTLENIYRPICENKRVQFDIHNEVKLCTQLYSDQVRLNQILFNLLSNAVKFTPNGRIEVSFSGSCCNNSATDFNLRIEVKDSGIGIEPEKIDSVFEPFIQEDSTTTREYGGSGLGLTIVKNLVEMFQGRIDVTSEKGQGSTFIVTLPVHCGEGIEGGAERVESIEPQDLFNQPLKVLIVEDNHTNAFILQAFCKKYHMDVEWKKDGYEALEALRQETFDLILMDNQLPHLGGIETTREIRQDLGLSVPIYACTADTQQQTRDGFIEAGADFVIIKPIKEKALHKAFLDFKKRFYQPLTSAGKEQSNGETV